MSLTGLNISKLDKSKTKFKAIEINKVFKGNTIETQKSLGSSRQHGGLQVLGKVGPTRRMPPPVHLPSLKSEHGFSDPVNLVPSGGSGWGGAKDEDKNASGVSAASVLASSSQPTSKSNVKQENSHNGTASSSGQLWSNVTSGKQGTALLSKKQFQEDFPELAANLDDKVHSSPKKDDKQESRISLGPSLKPQNMLSWREGGGRRQTTDEDDEEEKKESSDQSKPRNFNSSEDEDPDMRRRAHRAEFGAYPPMPPYVPSQAGVPTRLMKPPMMGRMPGAHMMYGPPVVPPQFVFHHHRPGYGPPPPFPGYLPPPPRPHMSYPRPDARAFHHGIPSHARIPPCEGSDRGSREVIVKDRSLKEFDEIGLWEGGWASKINEVDYSKKLEFSDDEDSACQKMDPSCEMKAHQSPLPAKEVSSFKNNYEDEDVHSFEVKTHEGDRGKKRDYDDVGMKDYIGQTADEYEYNRPRGTSEWIEEPHAHARRKVPESFRNDDFYKPPSKSSRNENYYCYEDVYDQECNYVAVGGPQKSGQQWMKLEDREYQETAKPIKPSKASFKEYTNQPNHETKSKRFSSTDSDRRGDYNDFRYEDRTDEKPCTVHSDRNSGPQDRNDLVYSSERKTFTDGTVPRSPKHNDNISELTGSSDPTYPKSPLASEKSEKSKRSSTDEERGDRGSTGSLAKEKTPVFEKTSSIASSRHVCPPPITPKYTRQDMPTQSNYISLKKTNKVTNSSAGSLSANQSSARNSKNLHKDNDLEEVHLKSHTSQQSFESPAKETGGKNWGDSIDEEELEFKNIAWENSAKKGDHCFEIEEEEEAAASVVIEQFEHFNLEETGTLEGRHHKHKPINDKLQTSKDVWSSSGPQKDHSGKYLRHDDRHSTRKQTSDDYLSSDDGHAKKNASKGGQFGAHSGQDVGYQEFTRSSNYNRSSHSQQFRRPNYHVLTSRKSNMSETNIPEKEKIEHDPKSKSEHSGRSESNPWRIPKSAGNLRDEKRESNASSHRSTENSYISEVADRQGGGGLKVEATKVDEGSGDGICKKKEVGKDLHLKDSITSAQSVQQKVGSVPENAWISNERKDGLEISREGVEGDRKKEQVELTSVVLANDKGKEKQPQGNLPIAKSTVESVPSEENKPVQIACQPPPNVWLNRQKQVQRKAETQALKNVWSKTDSIQKTDILTNVPKELADEESKAFKDGHISKESFAPSQSQSGAGSGNPIPKKPPALMDMQIAKPPSSLLKESQLLSSEDILDSDWNSSDNLSYLRRLDRKGGYSRTIRGSGNQRRRVVAGTEQQQDSGKLLDGEQEIKSRRGHTYKYGEAGRKSRGASRGYRGRSDIYDDSDPQDASKHSEDRRRTSYSRGESRSLTGDRKMISGSMRGRRRGNKTSISSGTGATSNCPTNESDIGNEEWETASESSDVLQNNSQPPRNPKAHKNEDERPKQGKHAPEAYQENAEEATVEDHAVNRLKKGESTYYASKNPRTQQSQRFQQKRDHAPKSLHPAGKLVQVKPSSEQMKDKFTAPGQRNTPTANSVMNNTSDKIKNETTSNPQNKTKSSKTETGEMTKPKYEREKKDILATIDVNNYASVVVVDNHPEVSIDDPSFLFEKNEGFQEVTSRRTLKSKLKAAQQEEALKKAAEQQKAQAAATQAKKMDKDSAKARLTGTISTGDKLQRSTKPIQARSNRTKDTKRVGGPSNVTSAGRKFSISEDERNAVLPKIENWNNDMAKSIPPLAPSIPHSQSSTSSASVPVPASTPSMFPSNNINSEPTVAASTAMGSFGVTPTSHHLCPQDGGINAQAYQPMYTFPVENWEKESSQEVVQKSNASLSSSNASHIYSSISLPISEWSDQLLVTKPAVIPSLAGDKENLMTLEKRDLEGQQQNLREGSIEKMPLNSPKTTTCHNPQINEAPIALQPSMIHHELNTRHASSAIPKNDTQTCDVKGGTLGVSISNEEKRAVKKLDGSSAGRPQQGNRTYESLEMHPGIFKYKQNEDSSEIKLDFAFDTSLQSKMPEVEGKTPDGGATNSSTNLSSMTAGANNNSSGIGCSVTSSSHLPQLEMMSASDEDLGYKLAQVKNVWDRENAINYEQGMVSGNPRNAPKHAVPVSSSMSMDINDQIRQQQASSYLSGNERIVQVAPSQVDGMESSSGVVPSNSHQQPARLSYTDAEMTFKDASVDTYLSEQPNVCKVKPQLQASLATPSLNQFSGVASPPTPAQQQFMITFGQGSYAFGSQLLTPDCGIGLPFGQPTYLAAPATQTPLLAPLAIASQPSLFLGHNPNVQSDLYGTPYRNLFGLTQPPQQQQSTIMVSSATSTLMSTAIKNQHHQYSEYFSSGSKQQGNSLPTFPYGQLLGNSPIIPQPSQIGLQYETAQFSALQPDASIMPPTNSQIVGSHLMPQRNATLHGLSSSTYYPQTLLQQSCFQQQQRSGSHLQGSFQQYQLSAAFNMQPVAFSVAAGNGTPIAAAAALNFQAQQPLANQSQLKHSAPPFKPSQRLALSPNGQKFSTPGMLNGNNLNKNSLLSFHLQQQQQEQQNNSYLMQQNLPNNLGSSLTNNGMSLPSQYQLFTQQQQLQQLQQSIQLHQQQQQQQHSVSGFMTQSNNYSGKERYGMPSVINQQNKFSQSLSGPSQLHQKFDQFSSESATMDSQQAPSSLLQNQFQSCKAGEMTGPSASISASEVVSSKSSSSSSSSSCSSSNVSSSAPASGTSIQTPMNVPSCDATSSASQSTSASSSSSSPISFKTLNSSPSAGNKWNSGNASMNFQGTQQYQHQSFTSPGDRFSYTYQYSGTKSDISRDNSQSSRTSIGSKSVTARNVSGKSESSGSFGGGGSFQSGLVRNAGVSGSGNVGVASRADRPTNYYLNAKDMKDLQAEERKKAMMDIQSFLNPENKPPQKLVQNPPSSASPSFLTSSTPTPKPSNLPEGISDSCSTSSIQGDKEVASKVVEN